MSRLLEAVKSFARLVDAVAGTPAPVSAHVDDELLQMVYVTLTARGVNVEVQVTPGVLVSDALLRLIDTDGDGVISESEAEAYVDLLRRSLSVSFEDESVAVEVVRSSFPEGDLLRRGGGTITVHFAAAAPNSGAPEHAVTVTNSYAPMQTVVQGSVTLLADYPVDVEAIAHIDEGRGLSVRYAAI